MYFFSFNKQFLLKKNKEKYFFEPIGDLGFDFFICLLVLGLKKKQLLFYNGLFEAVQGFGISE